MTKKTLLGLHWYLCGLGLVGIIYGLSWKLHAALLIGRQATSYHSWATIFFYPDKPQQLIFFVAGSIGLFVHFSIFRQIIERDDLQARIYCLTEYWSIGFVALYAAVPASLNVIVAIWFPSGANPSMPVIGYLLSALWLVVLLVPFWGASTVLQLKDKFSKIIEVANQYAERRAWRYVNVGLVVFSCAQLITIFLPYLKGDLLMMNEYMDIPGQVWLQDKYISTTHYINSHNLGGLLQYDPKVDHGNAPVPPPDTFVQIPKSKYLERFIKMNQAKYYYNTALGALVIHGAMSLEERSQLINFLPDEEHKAKISSLYDTSRDWDQQLRFYTPEETEFLKNNRLEMLWKILNRWVIHHHNFVLGPINEYVLGKPLRDISMQYGVLNTVLMAHFMEKTGGISYGNYFKKWYALWVLYYALFIAVVFMLFRTVHYAALVCMLAFGFVNMIDYQFILLGPGINPIRHFYDLPVIAFLYVYLRTGKKGFLAAAFLFGLVSVVNNTQFGLVLIGTLSMLMFMKAFEERKASSLYEAGCALMACMLLGVIGLIGALGKDHIAPYYFEGFLGFPIGKGQLFFMVLVWGGCYLLLSRLGKVVGQWRYMALFLLFYSQGLLVYYAWGGTQKHLLTIAPILVLAGVTFVKLISDYGFAQRFKKPVIIGLTLVAVVQVYIPGLITYYSTKHEYEAVFDNHKTYNWNLERAQFKSTMDPEYFLDSIALIQHFANSENGIYIISKYDNLLPFLAKKYSAMPFFDVSWILLTQNEVNLCIESVRTKKPLYLFVDTDIERNLNGEIVTIGLPFVSNPGGESLQRVKRLNLLKDVFAAVKEEYVPVEQGLLLTVYKRKDSK